MKPLYLAFILLFATSGLLAQINTSEKYVEVATEDTLLAQPDYYEYFVRVVPYSESEDISSYQDAFQVEKQQREINHANERLLNVVKNRKITYKKGQGAAFVKMPGPLNAVHEYILTFSNVKQLANFFDDIKDITQLEGYISLSKSSKSDIHEKAVTEKALEKARKKAAVLAQAAQVKLAGIIQIRESIPESTSFTSSVIPGWRIYPPLSSMSQNIIDDLLQITYRRALIVRFAIEN